jgi:amino acid permease
MAKDSNLLPISRDTGTSSDTSSSSAKPHDMSEMSGSQKVANETHRGMKSRHLTMIGMYTPQLLVGTVV